MQHETTNMEFVTFRCDFKAISGAAQGGGGSFKNRTPIGGVGFLKSRITDPDGRRSPLMDRKVVGACWSCVFCSGCDGCSGHLTTTAECSVVWYSRKCSCNRKVV